MVKIENKNHKINMQREATRALADRGVEAVTCRKTKSHKKRLENGLTGRTLTGWWRRVTDQLMHQTAFNGGL